MQESTVFFILKFLFICTSLFNKIIHFTTINLPLGKKASHVLKADGFNKEQVALVNDDFVGMYSNN